jgi:hypothetical protein
MALQGPDFVSSYSLALPRLSGRRGECAQLILGLFGSVPLSTENSWENRLQPAVTSRHVRKGDILLEVSWDPVEQGALSAIELIDELDDQHAVTQ